MNGIIRQSNILALSLALAAGMGGVAFAQSGNSQANIPEANNYGATAPTTNSQQYNRYTSETGNQYKHSAATIRSTQEQLKNDGFYTGKIDGVDGPMTHSAIRKFQQSKNVAVNGRLDKKTCQRLGVNNQS